MLALVAIGRLLLVPLLVAAGSYVASEPWLDAFASVQSLEHAAPQAMTAPVHGCEACEPGEGEERDSVDGDGIVEHPTDLLSALAVRARSFDIVTDLNRRGRVFRPPDLLLA